jgi:RNA polymerase sigma factor (sigma-70 family)
VSTRDEALDAVLPNYRGWLYRVAAGFERPDLVDDLVQEAYVAMWRSLPKYDPKLGHLPSYLTTVARNRMIDVLRRGTWTGKPENRGSRPVEEVAHIDEFDNPDVLLGAVDSLDGVEIAYHDGEIAAALDTLTPSQRKYVVARFWLGLDPASREPAMRALCALVPEIQGDRGRALWRGSSKQRGARERLAEALAHLAPAA